MQKEGGVFNFAITVPPTNGLRFVTAILYFSPTGDWKDRTFAGQTDLIPVSAGAEATSLTPVTVHVVDPMASPAATEASGLQRVTALVWLAVMLLAFWASYSRLRCGSENLSEGRWWLVLSAGSALAFGWEWFGLETHLGVPVRAWAHANDVYYLRGWVQKGTISLAVAATIALLFFASRQRSAFRRPLIWLVVALAISFINLLSFHSIDRYAGLSWDGITLIGALKLACATATLHSVVRGMRQLLARR